MLITKQKILKIIHFYEKKKIDYSKYVYPHFYNIYYFKRQPCLSVCKCNTVCASKYILKLIVSRTCNTYFLLHIFCNGFASVSWTMNIILLSKIFVCMYKGTSNKFHLIHPLNAILLQKGRLNLQLISKFESRVIIICNAHQ